jgi:ribonuclease III
MDDQVISKARATSKKKAEETAAKRAFFALQDKISKQILGFFINYNV